MENWEGTTLYFTCIVHKQEKRVETYELPCSTRFLLLFAPHSPLCLRPGLDSDTGRAASILSKTEMKDTRGLVTLVSEFRFTGVLPMFAAMLSNGIRRLIAFPAHTF